MRKLDVRLSRLYSSSVPLRSVNIQHAADLVSETRLNIPGEESVAVIAGDRG